MEQTKCPSCDTQLSADAVLCIDCGYHLALKRKIGRDETQGLSSDNPYQPISESDNSASFIDTLIWLFWIDGRVSRLQWWTTQVAFYAQWFFMVTLAERNFIPQWFVLAVFFPSLWISITIQIKRWHDLDKSGFWYFVHFLPIIGTLYAWIDLGLQRGTKGYNQYGKDPVNFIETDG